MPISAICPQCGKNYQVPDKLAGYSVQCKACQAQFTLPAADNLIDLAPASTPPPPRRPADAPSTKPITTHQEPPTPSLARRIASILIGPLDWNFWLFLTFFALTIIGFTIPSTQNPTACSSLIVGLLLFFFGAIWAARLMSEEGVSILGLLTIFISPFLFLLFYYKVLLSNWDLYRHPMYCQIRGFLLILTVLTVAQIATCGKPTPHASIPKDPEKWVIPIGTGRTQIHNMHLSCRLFHRNENLAKSRLLQLAPKPDIIEA